MDTVKLECRSTIGIIDPTRVSQASNTITLRKQLEMYKDMTMAEFNKDVACVSKDVRVQVSLYIAKIIHTFVHGGKKTITIPYFS
jgi:hypothetical protein